MNTNPLVSVVIPIYNAQDCLNETLSALAKQTLANIEFICVDDGSTDGSGAIIDRFSKLDNRFIPVHTANQGAYRARETGIEHARGDYVGFCDADDIPSPNMYAEMVQRTLDGNPDIVVCAFQRVSSAGNVLSTEMQGLPAGTIKITSKCGWFVTVNTSLWNKIFRKSLIETRIHLAEPPRVMEDAMLLVSLLPRIKSITFLDEPLYTYRAPEQSAMSSVRLGELPLLIKSWKLLRKHIQNADSDYCAIVDLAAFIHLRVSAATRMRRSDRLEAARTIDSTLKESFPLLRQSPFMKLSYVNRHPRLLMTFIAYTCHRAHLLDFALGAYAKLIELAGVEIKW